MSAVPSRRTIRDLVAEGAIIAIQDGNHGGSHPKASEYVPDGIPFVMASDLQGGRIRFEDCQRLPKERTDRLRIGFAKSGDVLLTHKGTVGEVAIVPAIEDYVMLTPQVTYYRVDSGKLEPKYLAQAFRSPDFQRELKNISAQSTRPYVAISTQRHLSIPWVPVDNQRRIASILGAYDDLIEVNRRRVAALEEIAQWLFEEWFVRFRFPNHENVPILNTPDGPLPEGWNIHAVSEVTGFLSRGITPKYDNNSSTMVVGQKCIRNGRLSLEPARRQSKVPPPLKIVQPGDILVNSTGVGTLGRVAQAETVPEGLTVDSHVTIVRPARIEDRDYIGRVLLALQPVFERLGTGSTGQTELSRHAIAAREILWPPADLRDRFGEIVRPMRELVAGLAVHNQRLASSRDLLLPRLISGQLSVETTERELEAAA